MEKSNLNMSNKKQVTKEEFDQFISSYPNTLETDVAQMFEPPLKTWNDFTIAPKWPDSVVAFSKLYDGSDYHDGMQPEYYIFEKYYEQTYGGNK
jgi:hypothetical protein